MDWSKHLAKNYQEQFLASYLENTHSFAKPSDDLSRIANNYMLNVNPSEFDITFTKYVYNYEDLISIIVENPDVESTTDYQKTALKFYECNDLEVFEKVTNELKFLEK